MSALLLSIAAAALLNAARLTLARTVKATKGRRPAITFAS